jgi:hypothetical protein
MAAAPLVVKALLNAEKGLGWRFKFMKRIDDQGGRIANFVTEMF